MSADPVKEAVEIVAYILADEARSPQITYRYKSDGRGTRSPIILTTDHLRTILSALQAAEVERDAAQERAAILQQAVLDRVAERDAARERLAKVENDVTVGAVIAAGIVMHSHAEDVIAEEILQNVGVTTIAEARAIGVDGYDIRILRPVFVQMGRRIQSRALTPENSHEQG